MKVVDIHQEGVLHGLPEDEYLRNNFLQSKVLEKLQIYIEDLKQQSQKDYFQWV